MRSCPSFYALLFLWAPIAWAQIEAVTEPAPASRELGFFAGNDVRMPVDQPTVQIEPFVWYVSPGGSVGIGGSPLVETQDLSIDDPRLGPGIEAHLRRGPWRLSLLGALTSQHGGNVAEEPLAFGGLSVAAGETIVTEIDLDVYGIMGAYRVWGYAAEPDSKGVPLFESSLDLVAGVRLYDYGLTVERITGAPGRASGDMQHAEPVVGAKWSIEFANQFSIDLATNFGYLPEVSGQSSNSLDITAGFRYAPTPLVAAQIGYRLLVFDLESDDVEAEGALAGLYGGVSIQF